MTRIAVIGAGSHSASNHGPSLQLYQREHPGEVDLVAVCDLDCARASAYAERFGFARVYSDMHTMIRTESPDGLLAVTPTAATRAVVTELLPYRIPLLIEKPPATVSTEVAELRQLAQTHTTPHMISLNRRFNVAMLEAKEWLRDSVAQRPPEFVLARMLRNERTEPDFILATGIHIVDAVLSFLPSPTRVSSRRRHVAAGCGSCTATVVDESGATAHITIAPAAGIDEETYEIIGPGYTVRIDEIPGHVRIDDHGQQVMHWKAPADMPSYVRRGTYSETEAFIAAVKSGAGFSPALTDALTAMLVTEAMDQGGDVALDTV